MRGHIIVEDRFLHQGTEHHLFVTAIENTENTYRFEVRRIHPGSEQTEALYEQLVDFSSQLIRCPGTTVDQLITAELDAVRHAVFDEEELHVHDP